MTITIHPTIMFSWAIAGPVLLKMLTMFVLGSVTFVAVCMYLGGECTGLVRFICCLIACFVMGTAILFTISLVLLPNILLSPN